MTNWMMEKIRTFSKKKKKVLSHSYKEKWLPIASWNKSKDCDEKTKLSIRYIKYLACHLHHEISQKIVSKT